jgi:hypothetical protein
VIGKVDEGLQNVCAFREHLDKTIEQFEDFQQQIDKKKKQFLLLKVVNMIRRGGNRRQGLFFK